MLYSDGNKSGAVTMSVSVEVDASDAIAALQSGIANIAQAVSEGLEQGGADMQTAARANIHSVSGQLASSIVYEADDTEVIVTATASYAKFVEFGRGEVRPIHAKALHWSGEGGDVFAMRSGPAAPRPFMRPALATTLPAILANISASIETGFES